MSPRVDHHEWCWLDSPYGTCMRTAIHKGVHATFIGDRGFWFAWTADGPLGYGHFRHGRFARHAAARPLPDRIVGGGVL